MKKKLTSLFFSAVLLCLCPNMAGAVVRQSCVINNQQHEFPNLNNLKKTSLEKELGRKLTFREKLTLSFVKRSKKQLIKVFKNPNYSGLIFVSLFSVILPPIGVLLAEKEVTWRFWVTIFLTLLFWLPGVIFALLVTFENFCDCY